MGGRDYPERPILAASLAILRAGRVLVAKRGRAPGAGLYSLPGGAVEIGETLVDAARREAREEVGVEAEPLGLCGARDIIVRDADGRIRRHFVVVTYAARWLAGEGETGPEAADVLWASPEGLADLPTTEGLAETVAAAFRLIR